MRGRAVLDSTGPNIPDKVCRDRPEQSIPVGTRSTFGMGRADSTLPAHRTFVLRSPRARDSALCNTGAARHSRGIVDIRGSQGHSTEPRLCRSR